MERRDSCSNKDEEGVIDTLSLRKEVEFMRRKRSCMEDDRSLSGVNSSSDYEFKENDFNSSDSEWSAGEEKKLRKNRLHKDSSSEDDLPLNLLKVRDRTKDKATSATTEERSSAVCWTKSAGSTEVSRREGAGQAEREGGTRVVDNVEGDCLYVMTCMLDVIQSGEDRSVEDGLNGKAVNETVLNSELMNESVLIHVDATKPGTSSEGIDSNQLGGAGSTDETAADNDDQGNEEGASLTLNSVVASESGSLCSTPVAVERGRKRKRQPDNWERNKKKMALNAGEEYTGKDGKISKRRNMKPGCGEKCAKKCHENIGREQREYLFHQFWRLSTIVEKRTFINKYVYRKEKKS